jgi:hypothetical protein
MKYLLEFAQYLSDDIQDLDNDGQKDNPISASSSLAKNFDPDQVVVIGQSQKDKPADELFRTTAGVINEINQKIKDETEIWFKYKYDLDTVPYDIKIGSIVINTEHLMKMVNNRTVFYYICKNEKITNGEDFLKFMKDFSNLKKYYHYTGTFFKEVFKILEASSSKGKVGEENALKHFEWLMTTKKTPVVILKPTIREDISGIDAKFKVGNKMKTIQVKPYQNFAIDNGIGTAISNGALSMKTDILILYKSIGRKKVVKNGREYSFPDFNYIIADKEDVDIDGNKFVLKKWEAKGEKLK